MNVRLSAVLLRRSSKRVISQSAWDNGWACKLCQRSVTSSSKAVKPFYITTPIFYVNAAPHVGHLYTMVLADVLKRWQILKERNAILLTGTDEHGMKIQQAAANANTPPKEFCDSTAETFKSLAKRADLSNDHFVRTTDEDHKAAVEYFWQMLRQRGYIYESKHKGWYCVSDETYYPESAIEKRLDPFTGRLFMASQETGKEVEWTSEKNYHFKLSKFQNRLLKFYKANPEFVVPASRMEDVISWVKAGLEDLSISRPVERLTWGIRVPDDKSQTIYVWLDALISYITKAGYPFTPGRAQVGGWPADVQVIGKDIVRFHCIYWPAFLMALDIPPPKQILTHAHWTLGHQKMAKSTGNVVNPFFAMDRFGVDAMRYYLVRDGGIADDSNYGNDLIVEKYKKGLSGGIGGLVSRITRSKLWNVRNAVVVCSAGRIHWENPNSNMPATKIDGLRDRVNADMESLNPGAALRCIMGRIHETNKYLALHEPWNKARSKDESDQENALRTVYFCAESIRITGILLQPFMPSTMSRLLDMIGVDESRRSFAYAVTGADDSYGEPKIPVGKDQWDSLFPPLPVED